VPFDYYLSPDEYNNLVEKAINGGLIGAPRDLLLNGIFKPFAFSLPRRGDDLTQFTSDLIEVNKVERLANGQVPLAIFLANCGSWLRHRGLQEGDDFERVANQIQQRVQGLPAFPNAATFREVQTKEAIIGSDDMVDVGFLARGALTGKSVAKIEVPRFDDGVPKKLQGGKPWLMNGTAWLIAPDLVMTNHHVIEARRAGEPAASLGDFLKQGKASVVRFDYDSADAMIESFDCSGVIAFSDSLDYAIVQLSKSTTRTPLQISTQPVAFTAATYLPLNIIQHPRGDLKKVAFRNNLLTGADDRIIRYFTDTDSGSSGSPVCDDTWRVVALHCGAAFVKDVSFQGKPTAYLNFGTQIQAILSHIKISNAPLGERLTRE
jgi:V8-like Glu-specific endopeptidase